MKKNTVLVVFIVCVFLTIGFGFLIQKDDHDKRMELIEEKKALIELQTTLEIKENFRFIDSLHVEINKKLDSLSEKL